MRACHAAAIAVLLLVTATLAGAPTAAAAPRPLLSLAGTPAFSPNGDGRQDVGRFTIRLERRAAVTVRVLRNGRTVLGPRNLSVLGPGTHRWVWNGRRNNGRRAGDGHYKVSVNARFTANGAVHKLGLETVVDTVYVPAPVTVSSNQAFPRTKVVRDRVWFRNDNDLKSSSDPVARGTIRVVNGAGQVVFQRSPRLWSLDAQGRSYDLPYPWTARDARDRPLPPGRYWARVIGRDRAGNTGVSRRVPIDVSAAPLVEAAGTAAVTPQDSYVPVECGPDSPMGCWDWVPCGSVVASTAYAEPGALSYRSSSACTEDWRPKIAQGNHGTALEIDAPRGIASARLSMRGKPTAEGETDTAEVWFTLANRGTPVTSAAMAGESLTITPVVTWSGDESRPVGDTSRGEARTTRLSWSVTTKGDDSYDVAAFTVDYTYLTPRR